MASYQFVGSGGIFSLWNLKPLPLKVLVGRLVVVLVVRMVPCCCKINSTVKEFTVLLIHVLHVSHPAVLSDSAGYAREIVDGFFRKYTQINCSHVEPHTHKFHHLKVDSRLEIVFAGKPRGYKVPNYKIYKYENSEGLSIAFEVETRLIRRYIPPHSEFDLVEVERTDFLPLTGCTQRQVADMRVSYMNMEDVGRS